jgi:DNA-binding CsgD family transcriptional regulator
MKKRYRVWVRAWETDKGYVHVEIRDKDLGIVNTYAGKDHTYHIMLRKKKRKSHKRLHKKRDAEILQRRLQGESLAEIAGDYGMTRERVRQIAQRAYRELGYVGSHSTIAVAMQDAQKRPRAQEKLFELFAERAKRAVPCTVCRYWVLRQAARPSIYTRTCSPECRKLLGLVRFHISPEAKRRWQESPSMQPKVSHTDRATRNDEGLVRSSAVEKALRRVYQLRGEAFPEGIIRRQAAG